MFHYISKEFINTKIKLKCSEYMGHAARLQVPYHYVKWNKRFYSLEMILILENANNSMCIVIPRE